MLKTKLLYFILVLLSVHLSAQPVNNEVGDVVQPSPNVAALNKYTDIPVSKFTGVPNVGIPIYTIQDGPIQVPISLSYHAGGIKLGETASWVGLGWSLSTGGMVNRSIVGIADDHPTGNGYLTGAFKDPSTLHTEQTIANGGIDTEADIFYFNFGGYSGKMIYAYSQNNGLGGWNMYPLSDLKVQEIKSGQKIEGFEFTTPQGVKYLFGMGEEERTFVDQHSVFDPIGANTTAWYLKKITSPDDKYYVEFEYVKEDYKFQMIGSNYLALGGIATNGPGSGAGVSCIESAHTDIKTLYSMVEGKRLTSIKTSRTGFELSMVPGDFRSDLKASIGNPSSITNSARQLDRIEIKEGISCKYFQLNYDYFGRFAAASEEKRLKLLSVQEISCTDGTSIPPYEFQYEEEVNGSPKELPSRLSKQIDHWGYYNGVTGNENKPTLIPYTAIIELDDGRIIEYLDGDPNLGADRNVNGAYMKLGSLK